MYTCIWWQKGREWNPHGSVINYTS